MNVRSAQYRSIVMHFTGPHDEDFIYIIRILGHFLSLPQQATCLGKKLRGGALTTDFLQSAWQVDSGPSFG